MHNTAHNSLPPPRRFRHKRCPPARHPTTTSTSMPQATCPCLTLRHWPRTYRTGCLAVSVRCRRGDQGIAAAAMAALAPWARPPTSCARVGAALAASDREGVIATCRSMTLPWAIKRVERARQQQGEGGITGGGRTGGSWRGRHRRRGWVPQDVLLLRQIP